MKIRGCVLEEEKESVWLRTKRNSLVPPFFYFFFLKSLVREPFLREETCRECEEWRVLSEKT